MSPEIKLYKKIPCPYCDRAINFLNARNLQYEVIDLTGWMTVPMIFINGKLIGGYNDMKALDEAGEFDRLVSGAS